MNYIFIGLGVVLVLCVGMMALFSYLAGHIRDFQSKKAIKRVVENSPYQNQKPRHGKRGDDFLSRDKVAEKKKKEQLETGVVKYNIREQELGAGREQEETRIVGVAEPVGFWSKFVMKQKLGFIIALGGLTGSKKGYWQNYIKAQAASQGKDQGRGR
jgi:hypothetical protein